MCQIIYCATDTIFSIRYLNRIITKQTPYQTDTLPNRLITKQTPYQAMPGSLVSRIAFYVFLLLAFAYLAVISVAVAEAARIKGRESCCLTSGLPDIYDGACYGQAGFVNDLYDTNGMVISLLITSMSTYIFGCVVVLANWVVPWTRAAEERRIRSTWIIMFFSSVWILTLFASAAGFAAYKTHSESYKPCFSGHLVSPPVLSLVAAAILGLCLLYMVDMKNSLRNGFFDVLYEAPLPQKTYVRRNGRMYKHVPETDSAGSDSIFG